MNYENKQQGYYGNVRHDLINFFGEVEGMKVLEIGAAYGETLHYLKAHKKASEVIGVELFKDQKNLDKYKALDTLIFGDVQNLDLTRYEGYFDVIILADVLEHVFEPLPLLNKIKSLLKDNGIIIVSIPNIRHYSSFVKIFLKGNFQYEDSGIFDYTHMRFYCKKDVESLLSKSDFSITKSEGSIRNYNGKSFAKLVNKATFGIFEEFLSVQCFFMAKK